MTWAIRFYEFDEFLSSINADIVKAKDAQNLCKNLFKVKLKWP